MIELAALAGWSSTRRGGLVVGIVAASGVAVGLDAKLLVLLVLYLELRLLELSQQPGSAVEEISSGVLQPIPHRIATFIVADAPGRSRR